VVKMSTEEKKEKKDEPPVTTTQSPEFEKQYRVVHEHVNIPPAPAKNPEMPPVKTDLPTTPSSSEIELRKRLEESEQTAKTYKEQMERLSQEVNVTKDELNQRKTQLEALALQEFEKQRGLLVDTVKNDPSLGEEKSKEVAEMIKTPAELEQAKRMVKYLLDAASLMRTEAAKTNKPEKTEKTSVPLTGPAGKAGLEPEKELGQGTSWDDPKQMVTDLYDIYEAEMFKRQRGMPYNQKKLEVAERMINKLWESIAIGEKIRGHITHFVVKECPHCHEPYLGDIAECPNCKKSIPAHERTGRL